MSEEKQERYYVNGKTVYDSDGLSKTNARFFIASARTKEFAEFMCDALNSTTGSGEQYHDITKTTPPKRFIGWMADGSWGVFHRPSGEDEKEEAENLQRMVQGYGITHWSVPEPPSPASKKISTWVCNECGRKNPCGVADCRRCGANPPSLAIQSEPCSACNGEGFIAVMNCETAEAKKCWKCKSDHPAQSEQENEA